jgi:pyruvate ferredoxin oxidoreductase delta subunit
MKEKSWKEIPIGGTILEPGNAAEYKTGSWRTFKPVWHEDKCIHCLICWMYCPDEAIVVEDGKFIRFDYEFCKGCGICANECPPKTQAIEMILDQKND